MRLVLFTALLVVSFAHADDHLPAGARGEALMMLDEFETKLTQLVDAVPAETMAWRPGDGVRSFTEVFAHIADANCGIPYFLGIMPPEGWSRENRYEGREMQTGALREAMVGSFAHLREGIMGLDDATLGDDIEWFGGRTTTTRAALFFMMKHIAEHQGQLVAYARVNGIVPPWSE